MSSDPFWIFQLAALEVFLPWITVWLATLLALSILGAVLLMFARWARSVTASRRGGAAAEG